MRAGPRQCSSCQCLTASPGWCGFAVADPSPIVCPLAAGVPDHRPVHGAGGGDDDGGGRWWLGTLDAACRGDRALPECFGRHGVEVGAAGAGFIFFYKLGDSLCTALAALLPRRGLQQDRRSAYHRQNADSGRWSSAASSAASGWSSWHQPGLVAVRRGAVGDHPRFRVAVLAGPAPPTPAGWRCWPR